MPVAQDGGFWDAFEDTGGVFPDLTADWFVDWSLFSENQMPVDSAAGPSDSAAAAPAGGAGTLTFAELSRAAADAAADARAESGARAGLEGPVPGAQWDEYCLSVVEGLSRRLFPVGLTVGDVRDDAMVGAGAGARRLLGLPAGVWGGVSDWEAFLGDLERADQGTAAFVVSSWPGRMGHAWVLARTDGGVVVVDPEAVGTDVTVAYLHEWVDGTGQARGIPQTGAVGMGRLFDGSSAGVGLPVATRALLVGPRGEVVRVSGSIPGGLGHASADALTDPVLPRVGRSRDTRQTRSRANAPSVRTNRPGLDVPAAPSRITDSRTEPGVVWQRSGFCLGDNCVSVAVLTVRGSRTGQIAVGAAGLHRAEHGSFGRMA